MVAHRYWRVNITACQFTNQPSCARLQLRTTVSGSDVATGGTAIAESDLGAPYLPSSAFDGNPATFWVSGTSGALPDWLGYDLGSGTAHDIVEIAFTARGDGSGYAESPAAFDVQYSDDGSAWTTKWSEAAIGAWSEGQTKTFTYVVAVTGTASPTLEDATSAASGTAEITGTAATPLEDLAGAGAGTHTISGAASSTLEDLISAGGVPEITGTASSTLEDATSDTQAGSYEAITGHINSHLATLTSSGAGLSFEPPSGLSAITLEACESAATGHHRFGTSAAILEALAGVSAGAYLVNGSAGGVLVDLASFGFGTAHRARRVRQLTLIGSTRATVTLSATVRQ